MYVKNIVAAQNTSISFEFFPPKSENGWEKLYKTITSLVPTHPSYVSVTYGAGGSTRAHTHRLVKRLKEETDLTVVAHLTCVGSTRDEVAEILESYAASGVRDILALRGDPRNESGADITDFRYAADLVRFIRERHPQNCIGVAGYPEGHPATPNRLRQMDYLKAKIDAGADYIVTQLFFDNRDFYDFCERCRLAGIDVPIIAGIMPVTTKKGLPRMMDLAKCSRVPAGLLRAVDRAQGEEYIKHVGIHWATEQVRDLLDNEVAGVHFYTLNNSDASLQICRNLGLRDFSTVSGPTVAAVRERTEQRALAACYMATDV